MATLPEGPARVVSFKYLVYNDRYEKEKPYRINKFVPPDGLPVTNMEFEDRTGARVVDLRGHTDCLDLDRDSFKFLESPSQVDWKDDLESLEAYCHESGALIKNELNPERVICYEVLFRHSKARTASSPRKNSVPIEQVHIDHTIDGGRYRIKHHLTADEIKLFDNGEWRWRIVNVWRPLVPVVQDAPLAMCDPRTVDKKDVFDTDQVGPHYSGEMCYLRYNEQQKWYWLSNQTKDEVCLFVCYDTHPPSEVLNCCPHASFVDTTAPEGCRARESVELRFIVLSKAPAGQ